MGTWNEVRNRHIYSNKRKRTAHLRRDGDPDTVMRGDWKKKTFTCKSCGTDMEYWKEDKWGDWIYSCKNHFCYKSKDFAGSMTIKLKKLAKQQQMNSRLYYRTYDGGYY